MFVQRTLIWWRFCAGCCRLVMGAGRNPRKGAINTICCCGVIAFDTNMGIEILILFLRVLGV